MPYLRFAPLVLLASLGVGGCYESHAVEALGPCGAPADPTDPPWHGSDVRAWVRTEGVGAGRRYQAILFDSFDPGSITCNDNVATLEVTPAGAAVMEVGRFVDEGARLRLTQRYRYDPEPGVPPLDREGAVHEVIETEVPVDAAIADGVLTLTLDGVEARYARLSERIATLSTNSQAGAEEIVGLLRLAQLSTWVRVLGWGSGAMVEYLDAPTTFRCALRGTLEVEVDALVDPAVRLAYDACFDFQEISLAGDYGDVADLGGAGVLEGTLVYTLVSNPADPFSTITGSLFLDGLETDGFLVSGGTATLRVGVLNYIVDASHFQTLDLDRLFATP